MCEVECGFRPKHSRIVRIYTPFCFCVLCSFTVERFQTAKPEKKVVSKNFHVALRFETILVQRSTKTQKQKGVIFDKFESVRA